MTTSATPNLTEPTPGVNPPQRKWELLGLFVLGLLAIYFLRVSWRKWPDPIVDSGPQWYAFWQLAQGATLYHDIVWNYGPLSAYFNAALFKLFGPGMMVLVTANLVICGLIVTLAYLAFRKAWGWPAAFAASAVFICVFAFSRLSAIANYNYVTPYAHESTHGMLLILATAFIAVKWCRGPSRTNSFLLGLCGGLTMVLKPEFMLAGGVIGITVFILRLLERKKISLAEYGLLLLGLIIPTLLFTLWFTRFESFANAFIDASRAWWMVVVDHSQLGQQQEKFTGFNNPWPNFLFELKAAGKAVLSLVLIWVAGWSVNRSWSKLIGIIIAIASGVLLWYLKPVGGWYSIGRSFPILILAVAIFLTIRVVRQFRSNKKIDEATLMALVLVLLAISMLARMPLFPRIYHLGFFQAAIAGMVLAATLVAELPRWTGAGNCGRRVTMFGSLIVLAFGCRAIAVQSGDIRADQTAPVGAGRDRFYATASDIDAIGALVNWSVEQLQSAPPQATVLVLPEGTMINYLTRHRSPVPALTGAITDEEYLKLLKTTPPDYVVLISRDLGEFGIQQFGAPGNHGYEIMNWVQANYSVEKQVGENPFVSQGPKGAVILKRK